VSTTYYADGDAYISVHTINALAEEQHVPDSEARAVLDLLDDRGLLHRDEGGWSYKDGIGLLLRYEDAARGVAWERNVLRRQILRAAASAYEEGTPSLAYHEDQERFVDVEWAEAYAASKVLDYLGLIELRPFLGHNFRVEITSAGYELQRDARQLSRALPTSAEEDEDASADVAPDALGDLILNVDGLLERRGWAGAARELARGDDQYRSGHWIDAVREYYAALESALKHRLDEAGVTYSDGAALRDLARQGASSNVIPVNYQALFVFADSIRSPRSHGAGAKVAEVAVGKAEALLMGNHTRTLLLYLGQRPSAQGSAGYPTDSDGDSTDDGEA
jgi:hypothetical protein